MLFTQQKKSEETESSCTYSTTEYAMEVTPAARQRLRERRRGVCAAPMTRKRKVERGETVEREENQQKDQYKLFHAASDLKAQGEAAQARGLSSLLCCF